MSAPWNAVALLVLLSSLDVGSPVTELLVYGKLLLLSCVPGTVLCARDTAINQIYEPQDASLNFSSRDRSVQKVRASATIRAGYL